MNEKIKVLYKKARADGWYARQALYRARVLEAWDKLDGYTVDGYKAESGEPGTVFNPGPVRLVIYPDPDPDLSWCEAAELALAEDRGVWGVVGEYWDGEEWQHADSRWGFIGGDWEGSGYDADIMDATMATYIAHGLDRLERELEAKPTVADAQ